MNFPEVDEETKQWLDSLPKKGAINQKEFTKKQDQRILAAWPFVTREVLAREIGCCTTTLLKRYRYLIRGGKY